MAKAIIVKSFVISQDGTVKAFDDLSKDEKENLFDKMARRSAAIMSEYYSTHDSEYYNSLPNVK